MGHLGLQRTGVAVLTCVALWTTGCSPLSPQIFSDDMLSASASDGKPETMQQAKASAQQVMRRYNDAVREHSALTPGIGAALIGLSALTLARSINHSNNSDLVGLGVGGSAAYLYGSTFVSRPRQMIYLAGSKALSCAIAASEPYDVPLDKQADWQQRQQTMETDVATLSLTLAKYDGLAVTRTITMGGGTAPAGCAAVSRPQCTPLRGATADEQATHEASCARAREGWDRSCVVPPARTRVEKPNPALTAVIEQAKKERTSANALSEQLLPLLARLRSAPRELSEVSRRIQLNVSVEVLKTEPNLQAILASTRDLRASALTLTGASVFKPALAEAQGTPIGTKDSVRSLDATAQAAMQEIERDTARLRVSRWALASQIGPVLEDVSGLRSSLKDCDFAAPPQASLSPQIAGVDDSGTTQPTVDDLRRLGLSSDAGPEQVLKAIAACQAVLGRPQPPTGRFDSSTRSAVRDGTACANIAKPRQG